MRSVLGSLLLLVAGNSAWGQPGTRFAYTGEDAVRDKLNTRTMDYGGFANSFGVHGQDVVEPWLPALFYEHGYFLWPASDGINISFDIAPEIFLNVLFMGRVTGTAELVLLNEAKNHPGSGFGLRLGGGYSVLGSTFGLSEGTPVLRVGLLFGSARFTYAYGTGQDVIVNHQIGIGVKLDL